MAARLCLAEGDRVVVADAELGAAWPVTPATAAALLDAPASSARRAACRRARSRSSASRRASASTLLLPLSVRGETHGLLAIAGEKQIPRALQSSLAALATEVSLALESAALTEEVHRRTSEARFGSLVQHSSDLITVLDATGLVVYQSPSIERVLGYAPEELVGTRFERLLQPGEEGRLPHVLADPRRTPPPAPRCSSAAFATRTATCASSRCSTRICSTTRTSTASCSTAAT